MSFNEILEQNQTNDYIKLQEGDNRMRFLSYPAKTVSEFTNKDGTVRKSTRFVAWVIDRKDNGIKPFFFGKKVLSQLASLEADEENKFENMPMPYDVNIKAKGAGTKEAEYTTIAGRNLTPLTTEENNAFLEKDSIEAFVTKLEEKTEPQTNAEPTTLSKEEIDEIPF